MTRTHRKSGRERKRREKTAIVSYKNLCRSGHILISFLICFDDVIYYHQKLKQLHCRLSYRSVHSVHFFGISFHNCFLFLSHLSCTLSPSSSSSSALDSFWWSCHPLHTTIHCSLCVWNAPLLLYSGRSRVVWVLRHWILSARKMSQFIILWTNRTSWPTQFSQLQLPLRRTCVTHTQGHQLTVINYLFSISYFRFGSHVLAPLPVHEWILWIFYRCVASSHE